MSIDTSSSFNNYGLLGTLKRSLTLKKFSRNKFSLNSESKITQETGCTSNVGTFKRFLSDIEEGKNYTQTLGRIRSAKPLQHVSALEEAIMKFSDHGISKEQMNVSRDPYLQTGTGFVGTLRRNMSIRLLNPKETEERLKKAKKLFQLSEFKESKKFFKDLLGSKYLDTPERKSEISLYLTAIYLLEKEPSKANKCLKRVKDSFLKIVIEKHIEHLQSSNKDALFPNADYYGIEAASEYEQIITNKLFDSFGKSTSTQNTVK